MAQSSFAMKAAAVTLISAAFIFALNEKSLEGRLAGLFPAAAFWGLDAYYLRRERLFRKLYDAVRLEPDVGHPLAPFSMDTSPFRYGVPGWLASCFAGSVVWFYGPLFLVILLLNLFHR